MTSSSSALSKSGNVTAASLQTSGLSFGGGRIEADTININATISVLADVLAPNTSLEIDTFSLGDIDAPVTIEADADLETVRIDAGFLGNLAISGFPGIGFDLLRSGYDEDGVYEALIADNEEFAALGIGREGFGIMVETDGAVLIETDGVDTNGSDVSIIASQIGQSAPIATRGGDVSLVSTAGNIRQLAGSAIDSGNGSVLLDSAGDLDLRDVHSAASGDAIELRAGGVLTGLGSGPFTRATASDGRLIISAGSLGNVGPSGFLTEAGRIDALTASGDMHFGILGDVEIERLLNVGGGVIDVVASGDLVLSGSVESAPGKTEHGDVILTAVGGNVAGNLTSINAGAVYIHAFKGALGLGDKGLNVESQEVRTWQLGARGPIKTTLSDSGFNAAYVISETSTVDVSAAIPSSIGVLGAPLGLTVGGANVAVAATLVEGDGQATLPDTLASIVRPDVYRMLVVAGGSTGDGTEGDGAEGDGTGGDGTGGDETNGNTGFLGSTGQTSTQTNQTSGGNSFAGSLLNMPSSGALFGGGDSVTFTFVGGEEEEEEQENGG
jgi:hypothetical protein